MEWKKKKETVIINFIYLFLLLYDLYVKPLQQQ